jgi:hypothetical protein
MAPASDSRFRWLILASAALVVALALAGAASAAPVPRTADLTLTVTIQNLPGIVITATGATVMVDSTAGTLAIPSGQVVQTGTITIPGTGGTGITIASFKAVSIGNLSGLFSLGGGAVTTPTTELPCATTVPNGIACVTAGGANLGGQMGLTGTLFVVVVPNLFTVPLSLAAGGIGVGGFARVPNTLGGFQFDAAPWTQGVGKFAFITTSTYITTTITNSWTTVASTTGAGGTVHTPPSGAITLVSPTYLAGGFVGWQLTPVVSKLEIHFVPEPSTAVLLATGLAGLAAAGRRRSLR